MATPYKIQIPMYEGPLDLLLDLIRKQEMDIHNIPIAKITGQYLEYLHKLDELDIDVSADFIYMAATLIYIKSKMLLPPDPLAGPDEQQDPRAELVHRLVEHEKFKNAAQLLYQKQQIEEHVWSKPDRSLYEGEDAEGDRKSTRLNSSHGYISYAVFCLKKKNKADSTERTAVLEPASDLRRETCYTVHLTRSGHDSRSRSLVPASGSFMCETAPALERAA